MSWRTVRLMSLNRHKSPCRKKTACGREGLQGVFLKAYPPTGAEGMSKLQGRM